MKNDFQISCAKHTLNQNVIWEKKEKEKKKEKKKKKKNDDIANK